MAGQTFVTATVWGQGRAAVSLSSMAGKVKDGEEECMICRDDVPACVCFKPCGHSVCFACVENMRAKNIFKADKGVKCPFCRAYIDGYRSLRGADSAVLEFLEKANQAASTAALARAAMERKAAAVARAAVAGGRAAYSGGRSMPVAGQSAYQSAVSNEDDRWNCHGCGGANFVWREFCGRCRRPNPSPPSALFHCKKDIGKLPPDEIVALIREKGGLCLCRALLDVGLNVDSAKVTGSTACMVEAMQTNGLDRLLRVYDALSDSERLKEAALHFNGNYGVQRLLEAGAKLRTAMHGHAAQLKATALQLAQFRKNHDNRDPFAAMLRAMLPHMLEYCQHEKGVYVVQCAVHHCANSELLVLAQATFPLAVPVSKDPKGIFVLLALFEVMEQRIWSDPHICEPLLSETDKLCGLFVANTRQLLFTAMHGLSGRMLLRAAALALPRWQAVRMTCRLASLAGQMMAVGDARGGGTTLQELLLLYGHNEETSLLLRDACCMAAYQLSGSIAKCALSDNPEHRDLVRTLIQRMAYEQEVGWLDAIIQELVGVCDALAQRPASQELLELALTQDVLRNDLDTVADHLADVKSVLGKVAMQPIVTRIMGALQDGTEAPKPRYFAPSVIQPELRYWVEVKGVPLPLPPPPPPPPRGQRSDSRASGSALTTQPSGSSIASGGGAATATAGPAAAGSAATVASPPVPVLQPVAVPVPIPVPQPTSAAPVPAAAPSMGIPVPQPVPLRPAVPVPQPVPAAPAVAVPIPVPAPVQPNMPTVTVAFQPTQPATAIPSVPSYAPHLSSVARTPSGSSAGMSAAVAAAIAGHVQQVARPAAQAAPAQPVYAYQYLNAQQAQQQQAYQQQQPYQQPQQQQPYQQQQQPYQQPPPQQQQQQPYQQQQPQPQYPQQQYTQQYQQQQYAQQYTQPQQWMQSARPVQAVQQPMPMQAQAAQRQYVQSAQPQAQPQPRYGQVPGRPPGGFAPGGWSCSICTYEHKGVESGYLACAMCGTERTE